MDYIINKKLILEKKTNFISKAKKIKLKLNKYIKTPNYIFRKSGITNILYVDDTVQIEKSFKVRGALSEILNNIKSIKKKNTIVLASTGNYAYAMANICLKKKIQCISFVSKNIHKFKLNSLKQLGVKIFFSRNYESAKVKAKKFSLKHNYFFSNGCNKNIFLGNASMMLGIIRELKRKDKHIMNKKILGILPVGNGSLAAPSSIILKHMFKSNVDIACVEPFNFKKSQKILNNKIKLNFHNTIADGAAIRKLPKESQKIIFKYCKYFFSFRENEIKKSIKFIYRNLKIVSEGAGALANSLIITSPNLIKKYDYIVVPICGGNIDKNEFLNYIK